SARSTIRARPSTASACSVRDGEGHPNDEAIEEGERIMMRREVTFKITFPAWLRRRHLAALVLGAGLVSAGAWAAPLALHSFSPGEALSSSAINQSFAAMQAIAKSVDSGQYVADGSDDVDSLQAALDQAGRSAVLLPPGVFDLGTKGLVVP